VICLKKYSGIYCILNLLNNKCYIGNSNDIYRRFSVHRSTLRNNGKNNKNLKADWKLYGESNFKFFILKECLQKDLARYEQLYKTLYADTCYNINDIVSTKKKIRRGKEAKNYKNKWSAKNQGENNPNCTKFNAEKVRQLKMELADGVSYEVLAEKYNTNVPYISMINTGYRWSSVKV
jgi:group I intron endonuclease